ncbi:MAG: segregation/condensation protein A [Oscillospiraceae bacterium]|nr:segregation/condensation protein A [Oscillospiraceae bacterium]
MEALTFKLTDFEGPLDLLLALIAKNKMNIYEIEIVSLIDQYLSVVSQDEEAGMDEASEFIEMAARLVYMKSVFLLPREEEQERLREELTGILVEYSACKAVAAKLGQRAQKVYFAVRPPAEMELEADYKLRHDPALLREAYEALSGKKSRQKQPRQEQFEPIVAAPVVSVSSRIVHLMRNLMKKPFCRLQEFFKRSSGRSELVATFLAVLELVRAGRVVIDEEENLALERVGKPTRTKE